MTAILDVYEENGVDLCYEAHASEDIHDGASWEMFLNAVKEHPRCNLLYDPSHFVLQQLDYLHYIDLYHDRIKMFHVKDAEFNPTGINGVYGGYVDWKDRAGRFRSLGDGQVDFSSIQAPYRNQIFEQRSKADEPVQTGARSTHQRVNQYVNTGLSYFS